MSICTDFIARKGVGFNTEGPSAEASSCTRMLSILSMNVAGLRAVLNSPVKSVAFRQAVRSVKPGILCLQEHKLQETHVEEIGLALGDLLDNTYIFNFACSHPPARKGYSGVACGIAKTLQPSLVNSWVGFPGWNDDVSSHSPELIGALAKLAPLANEVVEAEGRLITLEFEELVVINVYQPNSGSKLKRLCYRVDHWDKKMAAYLSALEKSTGKPVVLIGDLNVAHGVVDIHNFYSRPNFPDIPAIGHSDHFKGVSQLKKQAGCTAVERQSFTELLSAGFVDSFRHLHPDATGRFTYWSQRAGNRKQNRGLRLDYCLVSERMVSNDHFPRLHSSFICDDESRFEPFSDHAPMGASFILRP